MATPISDAFCSIFLFLLCVPSLIALDIMPLQSRIDGSTHIVVGTLKSHISMSRHVRRRRIDPLFSLKGQLPKNVDITISYNCDVFIPRVVGTLYNSRSNGVWILFLRRDASDDGNSKEFHLSGVGEYMRSDDTFMDASPESLALVRSALLGAGASKIQSQPVAPPNAGNASD